MPFRSSFVLVPTFAVSAIVLSSLVPLHRATVHAQDDPTTPAFYTTRVQPILQANCYRCHVGYNHRGGLGLESRAAMLKGGHDGPVLVPGDPAKSLLVRLIRHEGPANDPMPMPPRGKLSDADIAVVEQWVKAGAIMPETAPAK